MAGDEQEGDVLVCKLVRDLERRAGTEVDVEDPTARRIASDGSESSLLVRAGTDDLRPRRLQGAGEIRCQIVTVLQDQNLAAAQVEELGHRTAP